MTDKKKNGSDPSHEHDDAFRVDVPDDLLEEAVEAVERRVSEAKTESVEETVAPMGADEEPAVDVDLEATNPEATADLENMSVEDMMAGGFLPEKVVTAFNEANSRVIEAQIAAKESREKAAALLSESDAFRKRVQREKTDSVKFANESLLKEFLPILDNLERALHHTDSKPDAGGATAVREGVEITLRQFLHVLQKFGVTRVPTSKGTPFDPHMHEAVQQIEVTDLPNNSIAAVLQAGFMLHDRLLRPAMVAVARNASMPAAAPAVEEEPEGAAEAGANEQATEQETEEERLERIRRAGAAAREARQKKREEREAARDEEPAPEAIGQVAPQETEEEKLDRIRRAGAAAREARQKKREERGRDAAAVATEAADAAMSVVDETLSEREDDVPLMEVAAGFEADEDTLAEEPPPAQGDAGETEEERLERIRRVGAAAREARQQKRAERAEAAATAPAPVPAVEESPEEKLERIRRAGAAAREARQKKRDERMEGGSAPPVQGSAGSLPQPSFADEDLDDWESTVDAVRTDKQQGRR